jgi:trehalose 6-phosphate synthase
MPLEERKERWAAMMEKLRANTVDHWCASFLAALAQEPDDPIRRPEERSETLESALPSAAAQFGPSWTGYRRN